VSLRAIPVGPADALPALERTVRELKHDEPLVPVSVVVPTNATGVTARRFLGARGGVAAVDMLTLPRLAELLGGPSLVAEHRRPVSVPVVDLAIGAVLADDPGAFDGVAQHPSTVVALRDLHRELRIAGPDAATRLALASDRGRAAASVSTRVTDRLAPDWYDEADLLARSVERCGSAPLPSQLRHVVVFLPHPLRGLPLALVRALGDVAEVGVLLAATGDDRTDHEISEVAVALGCPVDTASVGAAPAFDRVEVVSATDADEEVRHAIRTVVDAARAGTPFARIAVLWPADRPYARLVEHHLDVAGLPWNGRPGTGVAERVVPRFLLDLLDVDRRGLRRRDLFDLLADLPIRDSTGRYAPTARWERVSRAAGVARDDDWGPRLRRYAARERGRAAAAGQGSSRRADDADALLAMVDDLRRSLGHRQARRTWADWVQWAERQIAFRLGRSFIASLDVAERVAWDHTNRVLDRLRSLDAISGPVRRAEFRSVFASEFEVAPGRLGRIGSGITIGSLSGAVGLDVDLAVVLGAADGLMPPAPGSGPLVGEADRAAAGLEPGDTVGTRLHRQLRSVLDAAGRSVVLVPRGDLRATAARYPSRWLDPVVGQRPIHHLSSHHAALLTTSFPSADHEHRLRGVLAAGAAGRPITADDPGVAGDPVLRAALTLRAARRSDLITVFDGDLSGAGIEHFAGPVAPTQLEQWVSCPHGYFVRHLLGVHPVEEPGDEMTMTAAERGNLVHRTLDRFHREVIDGSLPQPAPGWAETHRRRLAELFDEVATDFEAAGRTGRAASWQVERASVAAELSQWIRHDGDRLTARPATVISSEQRFGDDGSVTLPLGGGRTLAVKGDIDRVDRTADGVLVVIDHKTGGAGSYSDIGADQPTAFGTRFQLPTYAAGAWAIAGERAPVHAEYAFFARERFKRIGYDVDAAVWERVAADLGTVVAGIESGLYPNRPSVPGFQLYVECNYCQPDALGTSERWPEWERKRNDPRGAAWFAEPAALDGSGGDAS
jgi:RecB family exonuclease